MRCKALLCNNRPDTDKVKRHYFSFPSAENDQSRLDRWIANIGTTLTIEQMKNRNSKICSDHFHPNCYETDMMAKVMNYEPKRKTLKPGSIPTIFAHKTYDIINMDGTQADSAQANYTQVDLTELLSTCPIGLETKQKEKEGKKIYQAQTMIGRKFPSKPVPIKEKKTKVTVYSSTAERWNSARGPKQMTHDSFMMFLLDMYDRSKGIFPKEKRKKKRKVAVSGGYTAMNPDDVALSWGDTNGIMANVNGETARKRPHEQQVWCLPSASLDMPPPLAIIGSSIRYLLHTRSPCTWESEECFSRFHQNIISKYTSTIKSIKKEENVCIVIEDNDEEDESGAIIQTVNDIINDMVDMVEIVLELEEEESSESTDDDWGPDLGRSEGKGTDDNKSEDDDNDDAADDDDDDDSDQDDEWYDADEFKGSVTCKTCGQSFKGVHWYNQHKRICKKGPYTCKVCGKTKENMRQLKQHKRCHKKKLFSCQYCDKSFPYENHLARHVRTHTNDRPHKCNYCDRRFAQKIQLKCHLRVHTHEKPYKCKMCDAAFAHNVSLVNHTRKHH